MRYGLLIGLSLYFLLLDPVHSHCTREFWKWLFTLKTHQMFLFTLGRRNLKTQKSLWQGNCIFNRCRKAHKDSFYFSFYILTKIVQAWSKHPGTVKVNESKGTSLNKLWIHLLKNCWQCCFSKPFVFCPFAPNKVECTENGLNAWHQHCIGWRGVEGGGGGKYVIVTDYCLYVPIVRAMVVVLKLKDKLKKEVSTVSIGA